MVITFRIPSLRSLGLVFAGTLLGALLVAPVVARDGSPMSVEARAIQTRAVSCHGHAFTALDDVYPYGWEGQARTGEGYFVCDPHLPHRAVVTRVRFTVYDSTDSAYISDCALVRSGLTPATAETLDVIASVGSMSGFGAPDAVRLVDTSIQNATVDNTRFVYRLQCHLVGNEGEVGLYGADVTYTIDSANG